VYNHRVNGMCREVDKLVRHRERITQTQRYCRRGGFGDSLTTVITISTVEMIIAGGGGRLGGGGGR
jgi:hypothetical protein